MRIATRLKSGLCLFLSALMIHVPTYAVAQQGMISTRAVIAEVDRLEAQKKVQDYLSAKDVRKLLEEQGVSPEEASARIAQLSESELHQLADQVDRAHAGGDILVTVLIIVLIIFLIRKM